MDLSVHIGHLKLKNPLTSDLEYMRISLLPSLLSVLEKNKDSISQIKIFEMANVYLPQKNDLPAEKMKLAGLTNSGNLGELKGIIEGVLRELGIADSEILPISNQEIAPFWRKEATAQVVASGKFLGSFGQIKSEIFAFDLDMEAVCSLANNNKFYTPISKYPPIIEDLSFVFGPRTYIGPVIQAIKQVSLLIKAVELIDIFENTRTFRITYQSNQETLSDKIVAGLREKIIRCVEQKFAGRLKASS